MTNRAHLNPDSTTDRNGKQTTVYRRLDQQDAPLPPVSAALQLGLSPSIAAIIDMDSTVSRDRETLKRAMISSAMNKHVAEERRGYIKLLDRTTLMLTASALRNRRITKDQLQAIDGMGNLEVREYVALITTVIDPLAAPDSDLNADWEYLRFFFYGIRPVNEDGTAFLPIDLSTEESVSRYAAVMRFSLTLQRHPANTFERFNKIYTRCKVDGRFGQVLNEDLKDLVVRRPQDINAICDLIHDYSVEHAAGLEHMLDTKSPLSEGAL